SAVDALWRPGSDGLLRDGEAGAGAADRTSSPTIVAVEDLLTSRSVSMWRRSRPLAARHDGEDQLKLALALRTILVDAAIERFFRSRILLQVLRSVTGTRQKNSAAQKT